MTELHVSADEVRRLTLYAQGFIGAGAKRGGVASMLRRVSAVQLDTISVLARSMLRISAAVVIFMGALWPNLPASGGLQGRPLQSNGRPRESPRRAED